MIDTLRVNRLCVFQAFICTGENHFRKPSTLMWDLFEKKYNQGVKVCHRSRYKENFLENKIVFFPIPINI